MKQDKLTLNSKKPYYIQIKENVKRYIQDENIAPGGRLPSKRKLSKLYRVSILTVEQALRELIHEGIIFCRQGVGTFVNEEIEPKLSNIGFFYFREAEYLMLKRAEHVQKYIEKDGFDLKLIGFLKDYYQYTDLYQEVRKRDLKGAIIVPLRTEDCKKHLQKLEENKFPYVRLGNKAFLGELKAPLVTGNNIKATRDALNYLWNLGHRKISFIYNRRGNDAEREYIKFYTEKKHFKENWCVSVELSDVREQWDRSLGVQIAKDCLEKNSCLTAIIVEDYGVCMELLKSSLSIQKRISQDLSIISLSDWQAHSGFPVAITAMYLAEKAMGEKAAEILLSIIRNGPREKEEIIELNYQFIKRDSVVSPAVIGGFTK